QEFAGARDTFDYPGRAHTFDDFCPECRALGLQGCAFQSTVAELQRLKVKVGSLTSGVTDSHGVTRNSI
nr:epitope-bearing protein 406.3-2 [Hepatitis E virus]